MLPAVAVLSEITARPLLTPRSPTLLLPEPTASALLTPLFVVLLLVLEVAAKPLLPEVGARFVRSAMYRKLKPVFETLESVALTAPLRSKSSGLEIGVPLGGDRLARTSVTSVALLVELALDVLPNPESPGLLPKKNTSAELKPVLALEATLTSSQRSRMSLVFQVISIRSEPPVPPPKITEKPDGVGAVVQVPTLLNVPVTEVGETRSVMSDSVMLLCEPMPLARSTITPVIPLEKLDTLLKFDVPVPLKPILSGAIAKASLAGSMAVWLLSYFELL